jgi:hypothetical protein
VYRLRVRQPSLIVNEVGIVDNCSVYFAGVGLIPWGEISNVFTYTYNYAPMYGNSRKLAYLVIALYPGDDLGARVHPLIKLLEKLFTMTLPSGICVPESMLEVSVEEIVHSIMASHSSKVGVLEGEAE